MIIPENRNTAIFYTCGTCNLSCTYCNIHKGEILKQIDDVLKQSFEGDYYFNQIKKYFPRKDMLQHFETWGGEPFLHMERLHPTLRKLIEYYPYLNNGFSSTNFSFSTWNNKFFELMDVFGEYPYRIFNYHLQLSMDGPPEINDLGRGEGTTQKCLDNYKKLVELLSNQRLPQNVYLTITIKGTLNIVTMRLLDTQEKIINYYKFLEDNFITPIYNLNNNHIIIQNNIPNIAVPAPATVDDGKFFAQLVKNCRNIETRNAREHIFQHYQIITPFDCDITQTDLSYEYSCHTCGTGDVSIGFLPNNMFSTCHEGFTQIVEKYQHLAAQDQHEHATISFDRFIDQQKVALCVDDKKYDEHIYKMLLYNTNGTKARLASITAMIIALALAGQIEQAYIDETNALKAAIFMQGHTVYCIKDNYNKTGSYTLVPVGMFKLLLNGAMKYIQHKEELHIKECNL